MFSATIRFEEQTCGDFVNSSPKEVPLGCWADFEEKIRELTSPQVANKTATPPFHPPLFRGLGNSRWGLETTLERSHPHEWFENANSLQRYYQKAFAAKPALETFSGRRWTTPSPVSFKSRVRKHWSRWLDLILMGEDGIYEYLVYLRHHGYPSPLLDWSSSPYVAAFFAFDAIVTGADRICVYAALPRAGGGSNKQHCFFVGPYMQTHERHFLQQCRYSMCVGHDVDLDDYVFKSQEPAMLADLGPVQELFKFTLPVAERRTALRHLDLMNINLFSLFRSEDSLVRTIARRESYLRD
jgi:hypothetical protein